MVKLVSAKVVRNRVSSVSARGLLPHKGGGSSTQPSQEEENSLLRPLLTLSYTGRKQGNESRGEGLYSSVPVTRHKEDLFCLKETKER